MAVILPRRELIEVYEPRTPLRPVLVEDAARSGKLIVRGEFGRAGVPTQNRRVYGRRLWEREFDRLRRAISEKTLTGELNHPRDGRADMFNTSHLITGLTITPEGIVLGEAEIMEETPGGKIVAAVYRRGGKVGVSSRGFGSTEVGDDGTEVVQEDYQLVTFDFVSDPADQYAYPDLVQEGAGGSTGSNKFYSIPRFGLGEGTSMTTKTPLTEAENTLRMAEEIRESTYRKIAENPASLPAEVQESLRKHFAGRPVALLRASLTEGKVQIEGLKGEVAKLTERIQGLTEERDKAVGLARTAGLRYFIEKSLAGDPDAEYLREAIGDPTSYGTLDQLKTGLESVRSQLAERRAIEAAAAAREAEQRRALEEERAADRAELERTRKALERSLQLNRELSIQNYQTEQLQFQTDRSQAEGILDAAQPQSFEEVDRILAASRSRAPLAEDARAQARARAAAAVGGGYGRDPNRSRALDEGNGGSGRQPMNEDFFGLGATWNEIENLCRVPN